MIKKLIGLIAALAVIYGAVWTAAAFWLRGAFDSFAADLTAQGYSVAHDETRFTGFPGTVGLRIPNLAIKAPGGHGGWRWETAAVVANVTLTAPTSPVVDLAGTHRVMGMLSAPEEGFTAAVGHGTARLTFTEQADAENKGLTEIELALNDTAIIGAAGQTRLFSFKEGALHLSSTARHAVLSMREIALPRAVPVLSENIAAVDMILDLTGELPPGPLLGSLDAWRDGGGAVELRALTLDWPPARATGTGTLALDTARQPIGAGTVKFQGFFEIVAALQEKGLVHEREASVAKVVLAILAKPSATGERELALPLSLQDRKLHVGPVMLMEVPEVVWDENARVP